MERFENFPNQGHRLGTPGVLFPSPAGGTALRQSTP